MIPRLITLIAFLLLISACNQKQYIRPGDSLPIAFGKAKLLYDAEKYRDAAEAFETVLSIGRGTEIGKEAQFMLAESYMKSKQYILAAAEFERFVTFFPKDSKKARAEFLSAESYFKMSPIYKLDQEYTDKSINSFRLYLNNNPSDSLAEQASDRIIEMREKLARKLFEAAEYYVRTADITVRNNQYESAAIYYDNILEKFPETTYAEMALAYEIQALVNSADKSIKEKQLERYEKSVAQYEKYLQLFPNGKHRQLAEDEYLKAQKRINTLNKELADSNN
jgi:outer membrane protein assembly factor BamD